MPSEKAEGMQPEKIDGIGAPMPPEEPGKCHRARVRGNPRRPRAAVHRAQGRHGLGDWTDAEIVRRASEITATLLMLARMARAEGDWPWLQRHRWFFAACARLFADQLVVPFDE